MYNVLAVQGDPCCVGGTSACAGSEGGLNSLRLPRFILFSLMFYPLRRVFYGISFIKKCREFFKTPFLLSRQKKRGFGSPKKRRPGDFRISPGPPYPAGEGHVCLCLSMCNLQHIFFLYKPPFTQQQNTVRPPSWVQLYTVFPIQVSVHATYNTVLFLMPFVAICDNRSLLPSGRCNLLHHKISVAKMLQVKKRC